MFIVINQSQTKLIIRIESGIFIIVKSMHQSRSQKSNEKCFNSIAKLLDNEFSYESKESTRQELYEEIFKHKTNLRRDNHNLKRQIEQTKQAILSKALGLYFTELRQLSEHNQYLRQKHRTIYETKKPTLMNVQQIASSSYSPMHTPRSRRSVVNIYESDNSFSKPHHLFPRQSDAGLNKPRKSINNQNIDNLKPRVYGRNSLKISQAPRRTNQQLTQRKMTNSVKFGEQAISNNVSTFSQCNSIKGSQKSRSRAVYSKTKSNIFGNFIELMLEQQKNKQKQIVQIIEREDLNFHKNHQQIYVNNLEIQVQKTTKNIQKLQNLLQNYQIQIKKMQLNLTSVTDMTKQLGKVRQKYLSMKQKCKNIELLRIQVAQKQRKLKDIKENAKSQYFEPPNSIQMLLRIFGIQQNCLNDPSKCKQQLRNLVKGSMQKPVKRKVKVKQLLDTIREGRKKFKQLLAVYEGRIKKLQRKLISLKFQETQHAEQ